MCAFLPLQITGGSWDGETEAGREEFISHQEECQESRRIGEYGMILSSESVTNLYTTLSRQWCQHITYCMLYKTLHGYKRPSLPSLLPPLPPPSPRSSLPPPRWNIMAKLSRFGQFFGVFTPHPNIFCPLMIPHPPKKTKQNKTNKEREILLLPLHCSPKFQLSWIQINTEPSILDWIAK